MTYFVAMSKNLYYFKRRAISLEVDYEKVKFSNCVLYDTLSEYECTYM